MTYQIEHYLSADQQDVFMRWLQGLRDNRARIAVIRRVARMELGNFGDYKWCRDGVWEMRIDTGPGYRVYFGCAGHRLIVLLAGGDKSSQRADIDRAARFWRDWQERTDHEKQTP